MGACHVHRVEEPGCIDCIQDQRDCSKGDAMGYLTDNIRRILELKDKEIAKLRAANEVLLHEESRIGIESMKKELSAALLQLGEVPKKLLEAVNAEQLRCGKIAEAFWNEDDKLNADLRVKLTQAEKSMAYMISTNIRAMRWREENFTEKPLQEPPKRCDSYWDGNQCEGVMSHELQGEKHRFQGWTWVVSPPPMTEDAEKRICLCPSSGGAVGAICFVCNGTRQ